MRPVALAFALAATATTSIPGVTAGSCTAGVSEAIGREIAAVRSVATTGKEGLPEAQSQLDFGLSQLDRAGTALEAGRCYLALERLTVARQYIEPAAFLAAQAKTAAELTPESTKKALSTLQAEFDSRRPLLAKGSSSAFPMVVRAMREESAVQAPVLNATAPMWAAIEEVVGTLYYGGAGVALQRAIAFEDSLSFPKPGRPPAIAPLAGPVDDYERALIAAYRPPLSADRHTEFIAASAALKTARELQAAGKPEGMLYVYLRARRIGSALTRAGAEPPSIDSLRESIEKWRPRVPSGTPAGGGTDHSIAVMFLEQAEAQLDLAEPPPDALRITAAVVEDVLPEYFRLVGEPGSAMAEAPSSSARPSAGTATSTQKGAAPAREVTVTLVRWPYT